MTIWDAYFIGCLFAMFSLAFPPIKERRQPIPRTAKRKAAPKKPKATKPKKKRTKPAKRRKYKAPELSVEDQIMVNKYYYERDYIRNESANEF